MEKHGTSLISDVYYFTTEGSASITITQVGDLGFCEISCCLRHIWQIPKLQKYSN